MKLTELHKKNLLLQRDFIEEKKSEISRVLRKLTQAVDTEVELDSIQDWIINNNLEEYVK